MVFRIFLFKTYSSFVEDLTARRMKKVLLLFVFASTCIVYSCGGSDAESEIGSGYCTYNGHKLYTGEKGGCYYLSSGGNKEYVDKSYCRKCN